MRVNFQYKCTTIRAEQIGEGYLSQNESFVWFTTITTELQENIYFKIHKI